MSPENDLYFNVTVCATDDCLTRLGEYIAANLAPGLKVRVAYSNECWNFALKTYDWVSQTDLFRGPGSERELGPLLLHRRPSGSGIS